jgi:hypothetical protein
VTALAWPLNVVVLLWVSLIIGPQRVEQSINNRRAIQFQRGSWQRSFSESQSTITSGGSSSSYLALALALQVSSTSLEEISFQILSNIQKRTFHISGKPPARWLLRKPDSNETSCQPGRAVCNQRDGFGLAVECGCYFLASLQSALKEPEKPSPTTELFSFCKVVEDGPFQDLISPSPATALFFCLAPGSGPIRLLRSR